jgi:hypothetical protein
VPGNLLFADIAFPTVQGDDTKKDLKNILNYLYMLREELRYTMGNIGIENFNPAELVNLSDMIVGKLNITIQNVENSIAQLSGRADEFDAQLALLAQYDTDISSALSAVSAKADANASQISALAQYDSTLANSIAAVDAKATAAGAQVSLVASYSGQSGVITVASWSTTGKDTSKVYYATNTQLYYRYNGTAWVSSSSAADAAFMLAAINGQSAAKIKADKIDFEGFATFLTADDLGENGTTQIYGGRIATGTLYASVLAAVAGAMGYNYIAMKNGIDFRHTSYMPFTQSTYTPYDRAVQGLHAVVFNGDTVLNSTGGGTSGNQPTPVTGYIMNDQSATGTITQNGLEIGSRTFLRLMGKCFGGSTGGILIRSANPTQLGTGATYCEILVADSGIVAIQYQKRSDGLFDTVKTATLL